jgi:hypothetical protein
VPFERGNTRQMTVTADEREIVAEGGGCKKEMETWDEKASLPQVGALLCEYASDLTVSW